MHDFDSYPGRFSPGVGDLLLQPNSAGARRWQERRRFALSALMMQQMMLVA